MLPVIVTGSTFLAVVCGRRNTTVWCYTLCQYKSVALSLLVQPLLLVSAVLLASKMLPHSLAEYMGYAADVQADVC